MNAIDQPRSVYLVELAPVMASRVLKPGGSALIKTFQGSDSTSWWSPRAATRYEAVKLLKPDASRARSPELYLLASGLVLV